VITASQPSSRVGVSQKNLRPSMSASLTWVRISRDFGPWSDTAAIRAVLSSIVTSKPWALRSSHAMFGSAAVTRKAFSSSRQTVPSSRSLPASSHQQQ
jgi:hypothetical protein